MADDDPEDVAAEVLGLLPGLMLGLEDQVASALAPYTTGELDLDTHYPTVHRRAELAGGEREVRLELVVEVVRRCPSCGEFHEDSTAEEDEEEEVGEGEVPPRYLS